MNCLSLRNLLPKKFYLILKKQLINIIADFIIYLLKNKPTDVKYFVPCLLKFQLQFGEPFLVPFYQHLQMLISLELDDISRNIIGVLTVFSCTFVEENKDLHFLYTL